MTAPAVGRYDAGQPCWAGGPGLGCDRDDTRAYLNVIACPDHTPARLADRSEPGATKYRLVPLAKQLRTTEPVPAALLTLVGPRPATKAEVLEAAQHIYVAAQRSSVNFTDAVWRIPMDKAGVPVNVRRRAVVHAIREGWIEALDALEDRQDLEQYDRRKTRWRSHIYRPLRRTRPTTNGPTL